MEKSYTASKWETYGLLLGSLMPEHMLLPPCFAATADA